MRNFILGILLTVTIAIIGFGAYLIGRQYKQQASLPQNEQSTPLPTLPFSTEEPASPTPFLTVQPTVPVVPTVPVNDLIKQALFKKNNWQESDGITITVSTNDGQYASGMASAQGGGGYFFAAKVNGVWEIVADGNGVILCTSLTNYPDFPITLIPECYDQAAEKTVKR